MNKKILIMANGPSLNNIDLKRLNIDSFGMNNAYKYYENMQWYPTFWGCFDDKMTAHNKNQHKEFILRGMCQEYFTLNKEFKDLPKVSYVDSPIWRQTTMKHYKNQPFKNVGHTGANCVQVAINKGYEEIYLIGFDGHYNGKNPSDIKGGIIKDGERQYAWKGYRGETEVFNPLVVKIIDINLTTWKHLSEWSIKNNIKVINLNKNSQVMQGLFECQDPDTSLIYN